MDLFERDNTVESTGSLLRSAFAIARKRRRLIIAFAFSVFTLVTAYSFLARPIYTASGQLLIEREPSILTFEQSFQIEPLNDDYYQTHFRLLQSRTLADETMKRMKLYENEKFVGKRAAGSPDVSSDPRLKNALFAVFESRLSVEPIRQTRLVEVTFKDADPKLAADVLNTLFAAYIDLNVQKKYQATEQVSEFLAGEITAVRKEIFQDENKLQTYGAEKNIIALNDRETTVVEKLGALNKAMTDAQIDLIQKEAAYNEMRMASADFIPESIRSPLMQRLREDYANLRREYLKKSETLLPEHPEMKRLKTELDAARSALETETQTVATGALNDLQAAQRKYQSHQQAFNAQKSESIQLDSNAILYNSLKVEIDNKKSLLDSLLRKQGETEMSIRLKGLRASSVWIVDRAEPPAFPSSPKKKINMLLAMVVGLCGGIGLAFFFESLDNSVKSAEDIEKVTELSCLGTVPAFRKKASDGKTLKENKEPSLITHFAPNSRCSESYRSIRTTLFMAAPESMLKIIAVTSAFPQEGKSTTLANLAVTLAQAGKRVLVVDADLRNPSQSKLFNVKNHHGLTNYLTSTTPLWELPESTSIPRLSLINAGPSTPNPIDLLASAKMASLLRELRDSFDYILIDTPPVLILSDILVLASKMDGAILVAWSGRTPKQALRRARSRLDQHNIKTTGVILNRARVPDYDYPYMNRYYKYYGTD